MIFLPKGADKAGLACSRGRQEGGDSPAFWLAEVTGL